MQPDPQNQDGNGKSNQGTDLPRMGAGIGVGIAIGAAIGVTMDNIALGIGIGVALGIALGLWMSDLANREDESGDGTSSKDES